MQITLSITLLFLHEIELKKKYEIMVINRTLKVPAYFLKEFNKKNTQSLKKIKAVYQDEISSVYQEERFMTVPELICS